jgi:CheY-like chemotaxis protein
LARKILLADDSVTAQNMGRKILADAGYDVVTVNNGSAALKRIAELKPDLIVLDVYMPGYSGLEVCQRLKDAAETARIPVLLTVGKLEPFKAEEARRVKADAHIVKPFEASELLAAMTRLEELIGQLPTGNGAAADSGWTSRLSFPSKKKKEATEPEEVTAGAAFRDFRRGKGKTGSGGAFPATAAPAEQDPAVLSDIPRDITPQELDALSALAAKLDEPTPAAEQAAPPAEQQVETPAPVVEPAAESVHATFAVEPAASAVDGESEFEIPVEHFQPAVESSGVVAVNTAQLAQDPAPVDRNDEPMFASVASTVEQATEEKIKEKLTEAEEPAPSDTELAEALRLLTPATGQADVSTIPAHEVSALPAEEAAHEEPVQREAAADAADAPRWVAEPVALSPEESAISLEAEMFRTFAAIPEAMPASSSAAAELAAVRSTSVSAIAAAVESRLAEVGMPAAVKALAGTDESFPETAEVSKAAEPLVDGIEAEKTEHKDSPAMLAEQVPAELSAAGQEAPKAMAAAAAEGGATSARDAIAIANIVDSVLADLRPKILEEITKKLAGK